MRPREIAVLICKLQSKLGAVSWGDKGTALNFFYRFLYITNTGILKRLFMLYYYDHVEPMPIGDFKSFPRMLTFGMQILSLCFLLPLARTISTKYSQIQRNLEVRN